MHVPYIKGKKYERFGLGYIPFGVSWMRLMYDRHNINFHTFLFTSFFFTTMSFIETKEEKKQKEGNKQNKETTEGKKQPEMRMK